MMRLRECYDGINGLNAAYLDTFEVVEEVERYRQLWRPDRVRVILLAESHVHTSEDDFAHYWSFGTDSVFQGNFVRFVYCLANGERYLVNIPSNKGTWQFWKILFSCMNRVSGNIDFAPILKTFTPDSGRRIRNKIQLLQNLKEAGIWLVDASIIGINELDQSSKARVLQHCWQSHVGPTINSLDPRPKHIIVIGSGVEKAVADKLHELSFNYDVIPQPQARLKNGYSRYYQKCFELCSRVRVSL